MMGLMPATTPDHLRSFNAGHIQTLRERGWSETDLQNLATEWGHFPGGALFWLTYFCTSFPEATAEEILAWCRVLYLHTGNHLQASPELRAWVDRPGAGGDENAAILVDRYTDAADGDHGLALLAFTGGLSDVELGRDLPAGRIDRATLAALAALRASTP